MTDYEVVIHCTNGHYTRTPLIRPEVAADGVVSGYAGSDKDFCLICDSPDVETVGISPVSDVPDFTNLDNTQVLEVRPMGFWNDPAGVDATGWMVIDRVKAEVVYITLDKARADAYVRNYRELEG